MKSTGLEMHAMKSNNCASNNARYPISSAPPKRKLTTLRTKSLVLTKWAVKEHKWRISYAWVLGQFTEQAVHYSMKTSAGFRWWGARGPDVVGGPMCGYRIFRYVMADEDTSISTDLVFRRHIW